MSRILYGITAALVVATTQVTAQQPGGTASRATVARATPRIDAPKLLPGTRADVFTTIQGNALNSTNGALPNVIVRLRNARIGQIVESQLTDKSGLFAFRSIDPGSYIVEIMGQDESSVLAASQLLNVGPGEAVSAVVKLPFRIPPFAGLLGNSTPTAAAVTSQAASAGVLATQVTGTGTCDTQPL